MMSTMSTPWRYDYVSASGRQAGRKRFAPAAQGSTDEFRTISRDEKCENRTNEAVEERHVGQGVIITGGNQGLGSATAVICS